MGFLFKSSGGASSSSSGGGGCGGKAKVTMPEISTDTSIAPGDVPAEAKVADVSGYYDAMKRRKERNGVLGSFGFTGEAG